MLKRDIYAAVASNNDLPSDEIVNIAKEDVRESHKELSRVEAEMQQLEERMERLKEEKKSIQRDLEFYSCILAPIRRLPFDMLEEIFLRCLSTDDTRPSTLTDIEEAPLLLMQVCRTWRQACLSCPRLWTSLRLEDDDIRADSSQVEDLCWRIQEWFSRSGQCPIHIVMSSTRRSIAGYMQEGQKSVVDALLPVMRRCDTLYLFGEHQPFMELLSPETLVSLRCVRIIPAKGGYPTRNWQPLANLMAAPNLRHFTCNAGLPSDIGTKDIPFHLSPHLTRLTLQRPGGSYQDVLSVLQKLHGLQTLKIVFKDNPKLAEAIVPVKVSLPSLKTLFLLDFTDPFGTEKFLDCLIDLASLSSFYYQPSRSLSRIADEALYQDAVKNGLSFAAYTLLTKNIDPMNLTNLSIPLGLNRDQVLDCFRTLPYIAELNLHRASTRRNRKMDSFELDPLILQPNSPVLLPRLRTISIKNSRRITDESVVQFTISRIQALPCSDTADGKVAVLETIEGVFLRKEQQDIASAVRQYVIDAGIEKVPHAKFTYEPYSY
ncbi:hypothetical protein D9613_006233 [Agrocybe pediades]|uniref:F-box domain-containing protein n=1 Tax=Agrocybe pediades TaxID=84607 RepID=A0A8H4VNJ7_9AGAR|nr:hypothetical protein D9613_006233 [Agrocybe pediades]